MSLTYYDARGASLHTKRPMRIYGVGLTLTTSLLLLTAGCTTTIPQYVRGAVAARATKPIPPGATYRILRTQVASPNERGLSTKLDSVLRGFGLRPAEGAEAQLEINLVHTTSARGDFWSESNALFDASDSRRRRFAVEVARAEGDGRAHQVLWRGELQSDSANRDVSMLVDSFLRLVLSSFNRDRVPTAFSFRIDSAGVAEHKTAQVPLARHTARTTAEEEVESVAETAEPVAQTAESGVRRGREPMTMFGALFGTKSRGAPVAISRPAPETPPVLPKPQSAVATVPVEPTREPATPAAPPQRAVPTSSAVSHEEITPRPDRSEPVVVEEETPVLEFSDVGPTWHDAVEACDELATGQDVDCSIFVEVHSATPHLELSYLDASRAKQVWTGNAPNAAGVFCVTAARHGLYGKAVILIRSGNASETKKCKEVSR
ncbi:MAG: hypothetical protein VX246_08485 [Myxococcota bacterium]|nr:hypothetical protein [Myxococcota bacterium]